MKERFKRWWKEPTTYPNGKAVTRGGLILWLAVGLVGVALLLYLTACCAELVAAQANARAGK
jgi:hypothetical protein